MVLAGHTARPLRSWLSTVLSPSRRCLESGLCWSQFCFLCLSGLTTLQSRLKLPHCVQGQRRVHWDPLATSHLLPGKSQPCQCSRTAFQIGPRAAHRRLRSDGCPAPTRPPALCRSCSPYADHFLYPQLCPGVSSLPSKTQLRKIPQSCRLILLRRRGGPPSPLLPSPSAWAPWLASASVRRRELRDGGDQSACFSCIRAEPSVGLSSRVWPRLPPRALQVRCPCSWTHYPDEGKALFLGRHLGDDFLTLKTKANQQKQRQTNGKILN